MVTIEAQSILNLNLNWTSPIDLFNLYWPQYNEIRNFFTNHDHEIFKTKKDVYKIKLLAEGNLKLLSGWRVYSGEETHGGPQALPWTYVYLLNTPSTLTT